MSDLLLHATPDCTGAFREVSARNVKARPKPRRGMHLYCPVCRAHYPAGHPYYSEWVRLQAAEMVWARWGHPDRLPLAAAARRSMEGRTDA